MADAGKYPASGKAEPGRSRSGTSGGGSDATGNPGYPPGDWGNAIFGGTLPTGTGAPGSAANDGGATDATNQPGQNHEALAGVTDESVVSTGAPGTQGAVDSSGGEAITQTLPSDGIGPYTTDTVNDDLSGPRDSTQANDQGYASGGPQLPGLKGNEPAANSGRYQPGGGHVMRGGRAVKP